MVPPPGLAPARPARHGDGDVAVERERRVAGEVRWRKGHIARDWERRDSIFFPVLFLFYDDDDGTFFNVYRRPFEWRRNCSLLSMLVK